MAKVVIDPGHGGTGKVGGSSGNNATSPSGVLEKELALRVARHAEAALQAAGHNVRLTRPADRNLSLVDRAKVARSARADAFVSIQFNGFGDTNVQGTETWVAELSFITTTAEDGRIQDPEYVKALGMAIAGGVQEFVGQKKTALQPAAKGARLSIPTDGRPAAFRTPVTFSASTKTSPRAAAAAAVQQPLVNVRKAVDALPKKGRKTTYAGPVAPGGESGQSHIQGLAGYKDVFLLTHSDADHKSGRILVLDRVGHKLFTEFRLPTFTTSGPAFFHAGGGQMIGDVFAVPSESGKNASVIAFFDISDPLQIREFNGALRIARDTRDAAAVGITTYERDTHTIWLLAAYDSGTVDFYESPNFSGGALFEPRFSCKIDEKNHQHLLLFTDESNKVFAVGLNRGNFPFFDRLVIYEVDLAAQTMKPDPDRNISTGGGTRLRWGASLEAVGGGLALHCSDRDYGASCTINSFNATVGLAPSAGKRRPARARRKATIATRARKTAKKRTVSGKKTGRRRGQTRAGVAAAARPRRP